MPSLYASLSLPHRSPAAFLSALLGSCFSEIEDGAQTHEAMIVQLLGSLPAYLEELGGSDLQC